MSTMWQRIKQWAGTTSRQEPSVQIRYCQSPRGAANTDVEHLQHMVRGVVYWLGLLVLAAAIIYTGMIVLVVWWLLQGGC